MTQIDASKLFPCVVCGAGVGQDCAGRDPENDCNWVHTVRVKTMEMNAKAGISETVVF